MNHHSESYKKLYSWISLQRPPWGQKKVAAVERFKQELIGSFINDDGDGYQDVKKAIGLLRKTTTLHVHHAFLYEIK